MTVKVLKHKDRIFKDLDADTLALREKQAWEVVDYYEKIAERLAIEAHLYTLEILERKYAEQLDKPATDD